MAAETIGIPFEDVHVVTTQDTDVAPFDTGAYASRQAYVASNAVFRAARELKAKILEHAGRICGPAQRGQLSLGLLIGSKRWMIADRTEVGRGV